jgi:isopenicillin-N N-acyltransferase-like protein
LCIILFCLYHHNLCACTLWAATGTNVKGRGTLIAKNRDWLPRYKQITKLVTPDNGLRYFGLFEKGNEKSGIKMGINEKGLVVVSASAIIPSHYKDSQPHTKGLNRKLLTSCSTIDEALARKELFKGPRFLLLADKNQIALIEIGLNSKFSVKELKNGVLYHTNHFIEPQFYYLNPSAFNQKKLRRFISSHERLKQISKFMTSKAEFGFEDFITISYSHDGQINNSIWREGKTPQSSRTLSSWVVWQPEKGTPYLFIRLADPNDEIKEYHLKVEDIFTLHKSTSVGILLKL